MNPRFLTRRLLPGAAVGLAVALLVACSGGDSESKDSTSTTSSTSPTAADAPKADVVLSASKEPTAELDPRYQSYNVEMVEVTGGQFWQPYDAGTGKVTRPPLDMSSERLQNLAKGLGPAYVRVSGSWANSTYFDATGATGGTPPAGFNAVLTADQWRGVGKFADAVGAEIVTSFPSSPGTRDAEGNWNPDQARSLLQFSVDNKIPVVAAEMFNEPTLPVGMPANYTADDFARDLAALKPVVKAVDPELLLVGPGSTAERKPLVISSTFTTAEALQATGKAFDVFSYHAYPKVSKRCGSTEGPEIALTQEFLNRVPDDADYYRKLRDQWLPGAPMWVTETAQAACGGDQWASTYRDVIRYVNTLGRLGVGDGDVVFHNTLSASDYGLLDEDGLVPRPNYWAAVLWARLMGPTVHGLEQPVSTEDFAVYAHCTPDGAQEKGMAYAVVNSSETATRTVSTPSGKASVYQLTSDSLDSTSASLNGTVLEVPADGTLPKMSGRAADGAIEIPPATVAFVVDTDAHACS